MNARTQFEQASAAQLQRHNISCRTSQPIKPAYRLSSKVSNPVVQHLEHVQGQLEGHIDSLNNVVVAMQRINSILERMAAKKCKLNRPCP